MLHLSLVFIILSMATTAKQDANVVEAPSLATDSAPGFL